LSRLDIIQEKQNKIFISNIENFKKRYSDTFHVTSVVMKIEIYYSKRYKTSIRKKEKFQQRAT